MERLTKSEKSKEEEARIKRQRAVAAGGLALAGVGFVAGVASGLEVVSADQDARSDLASVSNIEQARWELTQDERSHDAAGVAGSLAERPIADPSDVDLLFETTSIEVPIDYMDEDSPTVTKELAPMAQSPDSLILAEQAQDKLENRNDSLALTGASVLAGGLGLGVAAAATRKRKPEGVSRSQDNETSESASQDSPSRTETSPRSPYDYEGLPDDYLEHELRDLFRKRTELGSEQRKIEYSTRATHNSEKIVRDRERYSEIGEQLETIDRKIKGIKKARDKADAVL